MRTKASPEGREEITRPAVAARRRSDNRCARYLLASGQANFPEWAREDRNAFWTASDEFERANGNTYREYELTLPRE